MRALVATFVAGAIAVTGIALVAIAQERSGGGVRTEVQEDGGIALVEGGGDLADLDEALDRSPAAADALTRDGDAWLLGRTLTIEQGAFLDLEGVELRLLSGRRSVGLEARGGDLQVSDSTITSWDPLIDEPDGRVEDGRAWVLARDGSQMTITDSRVAALGYDAYERYGIAWRTPNTGGSVDGSTFVGNYYGIYTFDTAPMRITRSVVRGSFSYGLDLHTRSDGYVIEGNRFEANGKHGLVLAVDCRDATIRNNVAADNEGHGIVLFDGSDGAEISGNEAFGNEVGIDVAASNDIDLSANLLHDNATGISVHDGSRNVRLAENRVSANDIDGVHVASKGRITGMTSNLIDYNDRAGVYLDDGRARIAAGNRLIDNLVGLWLADDMLGLSIRGSDISSNTADGIHLSVGPNVYRIDGNVIEGNGKSAFSVAIGGQAEGLEAANEVSANGSVVRVRTP